jgi:hypothetical protein
MMDAGFQYGFMMGLLNSENSTDAVMSYINGTMAMI